MDERLVEVAGLIPCEQRLSEQAHALGRDVGLNGGDLSVAAVQVGQVQTARKTSDGEVGIALVTAVQVAKTEVD